MKQKVRLAASAFAFISVAFWFFGGPNLGWTRTSIEKWQVDPVTQIEYPVIEKRFVPGLDLLATCLIGAGLIAGATLWRRNT